MAVRIGLIGCGMIGREHLRRINELCPDAKLVAVSDVFEEGARKAIANISDVRFEKDPMKLIAADDVDAVVITTPDVTHEMYVLAAIAQNKHVFVEKPLAATAEGAIRIMEAEQKAGKKLVQVGFMRRFDRGYIALKDCIEKGTIGEPLICHCAHRNPIIPEEAQETIANKALIIGTAIHEIDVMSWLLDDYFVAAEVIYPRRSGLIKGTFNDPQIVLMTTSKGIVVSLEMYVCCQMGYDIQCEVVGETGIARMPEPFGVTLRSKNKLSTEIKEDWRFRFCEAYDDELRLWTEAVARGEHSGGPDAWDGYRAAVTADACIRAQDSASRESVSMIEKPAFYC